MKLTGGGKGEGEGEGQVVDILSVAIVRCSIV